MSVSEYNVLSSENLKKEKAKSIVVTIILVVVGSALLSIVTSMFLNPLGLYAGGVTGIAQIILQLFGILINGKEGWNAYSNYLGLLNFILLMPFNVLAFFRLSKKYAIYTFISSIVQTIAFSFDSFWASIEVFENASGHLDILASVLTAASISGAVNGLLMRRGATSGGIIILCQYLNIKKGKSVGSINLAISALIMFLGSTISFLSSGNEFSQGLTTALYTLTFFVISSVVLDYIHTAYNKIKLEIVTEKGEELAEKLISMSPHGVTIMNGTGAYTKRDKTILICVIQNSEMRYFCNAVKEIDNEAFITILPVNKLSGKFIVNVIDK